LPTKRSQRLPATRKGTIATPYHKGNVAALLYAAAEKILKYETVEAITARRLCREVGVTAANFYNHYPSLEYLLLEIASNGFERRLRDSQKILKQGLPREEALVMLVHKTVDFALENAQLFRIMFGQIHDTSINPRYAIASEESFRTLIHIVYGEDIYRSSDIAWSHEHCQKGYAFFSFSYGLALAISRPIFSNPSGTKAGRRAFIEDLTHTFLRGLL